MRITDMTHEQAKREAQNRALLALAYARAQALRFAR
jgi:hypothetical protein